MYLYMYKISGPAIYLVPITHLIVSPAQMDTGILWISRSYTASTTSTNTLIDTLDYSLLFLVGMMS